MEELKKWTNNFKETACRCKRWNIRMWISKSSGVVQTCMLTCLFQSTVEQPWTWVQCQHWKSPWWGTIPVQPLQPRSWGPEWEAACWSDLSHDLATSLVAAKIESNPWIEWPVWDSGLIRDSLQGPCPARGVPSFPPPCLASRCVPLPGTPPLSRNHPSVSSCVLQEPALAPLAWSDFLFRSQEFLNIYYVPRTVLNNLHSSLHLTLAMALWNMAMIISHLQKRKLRHRQYNKIW